MSERDALIARLVGPADGVFTDAEVAEVPDPVGQWFRASIAPGTPLATAVRLAIRGHIRLDGRWLPFRSHEVLAPLRGMVWWGRVGGVVIGSDHAVGDDAAMDWKLLGLKSVARAEGTDVARSGAGRATAEGTLWGPTAVLPRFGVRWEAVDDRHVRAAIPIGDVTVVHHLELDGRHRLVAGWFERWGDPSGTGTSAMHPFGTEVTAWATFAGVTIASEGIAGWHYGTDGWSQGQFFRYKITDATLLGV